MCVFGKMNSVQIMLVEKQSYLSSNFVLVILLSNQSIASDHLNCFLSKVTLSLVEQWCLSNRIEGFLNLVDATWQTLIDL